MTKFALRDFYPAFFSRFCRMEEILIAGRHFTSRNNVKIYVLCGQTNALYGLIYLSLYYTFDHTPEKPTEIQTHPFEKPKPLVTD